MKPVTRAQAVDVIDRITMAGDMLGRAMAREAETQSQKGPKKAEAIRRLMGTPNSLTEKPHSASSAEAVVELDPEYFTFLKECRIAIAERYEAQANYDAAVLRAQLAVKLVAPSTTEES